jgi:1-acyl-sn-glycerol-3-phosphate acyltransferase
MTAGRSIIPWYKSVFRFLFRPIFRLIFHILSPIQITGRENIPARGAYLVVFNHVSLYDAPLLVAIWPKALEALGAQDIWERPGQNILVRGYGAIPVLRGEIDQEAVKRILTALRSDHPLIMAPEGGRSHGAGMRQGKAGIVYFIESTGVPVVPVGIVGTTDDYYQRGSRGNRPPVMVKIGKAFHLPEMKEAASASPRELRQLKVDYIMRRIAELLPDEYRGYYR